MSIFVALLLCSLSTIADVAYLSFKRYKFCCCFPRVCFDMFQVRKRPLNKKELSRKEEDIVTVYDNAYLAVHEPKLKVKNFFVLVLC